MIDWARCVANVIVTLPELGDRNVTHITDDRGIVLVDASDESAVRAELTGSAFEGEDDLSL